ncbi:hypothetical protein HDU67_004901 [Dinochytrium kinnereticum]|nr:hypothetical protein HDU67_004901 [Dinochytrium kinnereticum]
MPRKDGSPANSFTCGPPALLESSYPADSMESNGSAFFVFSTESLASHNMASERMTPTSATSSLATPMQPEADFKWEDEGAVKGTHGGGMVTPSFARGDGEDIALSPTSPCPEGGLCSEFLAHAQHDARVTLWCHDGRHAPNGTDVFPSSPVKLSSGSLVSKWHPIAGEDTSAVFESLTQSSPLQAQGAELATSDGRLTADQVDPPTVFMEIESEPCGEDDGTTGVLPLSVASSSSSGLTLLTSLEASEMEGSSEGEAMMEVVMERDAEENEQLIQNDCQASGMEATPLSERTDDSLVGVGSEPSTSLQFNERARFGGLVGAAACSHAQQPQHYSSLSFQNMLFRRRRAASSPLAILTSTTNTTATTTTISKPAVLTLQDLPSEVLASILLFLPNPTVLCLVHKFFHRLLMRDAVVVARWLIEHNHTVPRLWGPSSFSPLSPVSIKRSLSVSGAVSDDLRPVLPSHPLLACLKHPTRHKVFRVVPEAARCMLWMAPRTSRYDLQRIHRRAVASDRGLYAVADIVSLRAFELFGSSVANTVSMGQAAAYRPLLPLSEGGTTNAPPSLPPPPLHGYHFDASVPVVSSLFSPVPMMVDPPNMGYIAPAAEWTPPPPALQSTPTVDDRRALLDAAVGGDSATVGVLIDACALGLDARVVSEAFARAWDRRDPGMLCGPDGWLWPRCQSSRWLVLERLAREDEDHAVNALAGAMDVVVQGVGGTADGMGGFEEGGGDAAASVAAAAVAVANIFSPGSVGMQDTAEAGSVGIGVVGTISRILEEAVAEEAVARERQRVLRKGRLMELDGEGGCRRMESCRLHGGKGRWGTLSTTISTSTGAWMSRRPFLDRALDAVVACGSARAVTLVLAHRPRIYPRHLTAALDRGSIHIFCMLVSFGGDTSWPEDPVLSRYIRRPPSDFVAGVCWRHAFSCGAPLTLRRWEAAVRLGPRATTACLDAWASRELARASTGPLLGRNQGGPKFDPTRYFGVGFRIGGPEVIRVLSDTVDASFESGDALAAASLGDSRALQYCMEVGDWDEWPTAARCYRRILVQQRLRLPIPSREALTNLPIGVVTEALLCSLQATRPLCDPRSATVYARYQRRRHPNAAGIRINLVPVLEGDVSFRVVASAMQSLKRLLAVCDDPAYPGEAYCFIKGMLQFGLRDKNLLRDEDEFFLPDDEWDEVAAALMAP